MVIVRKTVRKGGRKIIMELAMESINWRIWWLREDKNTEFPYTYGVLIENKRSGQKYSGYIPVPMDEYGYGSIPVSCRLLDVNLRKGIAVLEVTFEVGSRMFWEDQSSQVLVRLRKGIVSPPKRWKDWERLAEAWCKGNYEDFLKI